MPEKKQLSVSRTTSSDAQVKTDSQRLSAGAVAATLFLCVLFGANSVAIKVGLGGFGVFTLAGIRFSVAAVTIWMWARLAGKPLALTSAQVVQLVPLGLIFFVQLSLFYLGQSRTTATHGTLITNALPFVVMVLAHLFLADDRFSAKRLAGLLLGFSGVLILFVDTARLSGASWQGDLLVLGAVLAWGSNAIYSKRIIASFHTAQFTVFPMILASPLFLICGYLFDPVMIVHIDGPVVSALIYQTFVSASFGMVAWNALIKRYGATTLHSFVFIMPLSGVTLGILLLGEPVTGNLIGAIVLVTVGLIVVNWRIRT